MMEIDFNDPRKWEKQYDKAFEDDIGLEFLIRTLSSDIPDSFFDEADIEGCILDVMSQLENSKQHDKLLLLYKHSEKYRTKFEKAYYLDYYCIDYYFFKGDIEGIKRHLKGFLDDPIKSIDLFLPIYDKLVYYGYRELSLEICIEMINKVKDASGLISGAEEEFYKTAIADKLQDVYINIKNGVPVVKEEIIEQLSKYEYNITDEDVDIMCGLWKVDDPEIPDFTQYTKDPSLFEWKLMLLLMNYMAGKNISFATTYDIWNVSVKCFQKYILNKTRAKSFNSMFTLDSQKYKKEVEERIDSIFSNKVTCAYAIAWGIQYVVDFIYVLGYISEKVYIKNCDIIESQTTDIVRGDPNVLWMYNFLYEWEKPDGTGKEHYEAMKSLFRESFLTRIDVCDNETHINKS